MIISEDNDVRNMSDNGMTGKSTAAFTLIVTVLAVVSAVFLFEGTFTRIMSIVIYAGFIPCVMLGVYMWATGNGYRWVNGPDWKSMDESQTLFAASKLGMCLAIGIIAIGLGIAAVTYEFPTGMFVMIAATVLGLVLVIYPVYKYSNGRKIGNVRFERKSARLGWTAAVIGVAALVLPSAVIMGGMDGDDDIHVDLGDESLSVSAPFVKETIMYSDIASVTLDEDFYRGSRVSGHSGSDMQSGNYRDSHGDYMLAAYRSCDSCIVVTTAGGDRCAFNQATETATLDLYTALKEKTGL